MIGTFVAIGLITLHMVDGRVVLVNPSQVTQVLHPLERSSHKIMNPAIKCIVRLVDGTYVSVAESCDTVQKLLEGEKP